MVTAVTIALQDAPITGLPGSRFVERGERGNVFQVRGPCARALHDDQIVTTGDGQLQVTEADSTPCRASASSMRTYRHETLRKTPSRPYRRGRRDERFRAQPQTRCSAQAQERVEHAVAARA